MLHRILRFSLALPKSLEMLCFHFTIQFLVLQTHAWLRSTVSNGGLLVHQDFLFFIHKHFRLAPIPTNLTPTPPLTRNWFGSLIIIVQCKSNRSSGYYCPFSILGHASILRSLFLAIVECRREEIPRNAHLAHLGVYKSWRCSRYVVPTTLYGYENEFVKARERMKH